MAPDHNRDPAPLGKCFWKIDPRFAVRSCFLSWRLNDPAFSLPHEMPIAPFRASYLVQVTLCRSLTNAQLQDTLSSAMNSPLCMQILLAGLTPPQSKPMACRFPRVFSAADPSVVFP